MPYEQLLRDAKVLIFAIVGVMLIGAALFVIQQSKIDEGRDARLQTCHNAIASRGAFRQYLLDTHQDGEVKRFPVLRCTDSGATEVVR